MHEDAAGRDAGGAAVQRQAEADGAGDAVEVGAGEDEDGVAPRELHRSPAPGGGASSARTSRPVSAEPVSRTLSTPAAIARARPRRLLGQDREQPRRQAGSGGDRGEGLARRRAAPPRLPEDGVAGGEGLQRLHAGQEERVIRRRDRRARAPAARAAPRPSSPVQPGRPAAATRAGAAASRPGRLALQEAAGVGERDDLGGRGPPPPAGRRRRRQPEPARRRSPRCRGGAPARCAAARARDLVCPGGLHGAGGGRPLPGAVADGRKLATTVSIAQLASARTGSGLGRRPSGQRRTPRSSSSSRDGDPGRLEDHRQPAAGVGAAADEVDAVEVLEAVARPQVEHLAEAVGAG